jgi:DNA-directed RNA polymerase specialized sigma24 family protein
MINYVLLAFGIFAILATIILIFLDKVKGEDIYFNIDVKEQEIKKVIEDAEEIISELNYTSEMVVKEIEEKLKSLRDEQRNLANAAINNTAIEKKESAPAMVPPIIAVSKKKKITNDDVEKDKSLEEKLNSKQQTVFNYAAQGMSITDIAKQMNIGQGEVMLILSLKNEVE